MASSATAWAQVRCAGGQLGAHSGSSSMPATRMLRSDGPSRLAQFPTLAERLGRGEMDWLLTSPRERLVKTD